MATAASKTATKKAKPAPVVEPDELEDELEELDDTKKGSDEVTFGASDLARHLSEGRDKAITPREIRTLIRKMARDGSGRVQREIIAGNRSRYNWSGLNDPEVKKIIAAFNNGELEADKQEKLAALKERKTAQKAAAAAAGDTPPAKATTKKATTKKAAAVVEEDDEELELDDESDE